MFDGLWKPRGHEKGKSQRTVLRGLSKGTGGDVAQLVERRTGTPLTQVRISGAARDFSPRVNFQCGLSYGVRTALACYRMHYDLCTR